MSSLNSEASINLALQALQNNPELSVRRAAQIYQVCRKKLGRRQQGIQSRSDTMTNSRKLSDLEEQKLVEYILDLDSRGFSPRVSGVEEMANLLRVDRDASPVGKRWAGNFIKRHPELKTRSFRRYDYQRAKCEDPVAINAWFRLVANTIAKYGIQLEDIHNFDETGFMMGIIASGMVVTGTERRGNPKMMQPGNREWVTVIQSISAQGWAAPPLIVVAGQYHLSSWYQESTLPGNWAIATTKNGWTDNTTGLLWLKHFNQHTQKRSNGAYRLLILDGHKSHHSAEFEAYCKENMIITLCMPSHSSHLLQPLDVGCFGPLKIAYGREIEHLIKCSITHISKTEFLHAFYTAFQATITESNIKGGFRGAGLVPLDADYVISKLDVKLHTPTPPEGTPELPDPWVSKTPKTIKETESQSAYLENRIRRHKSSSPSSIIDAMKSMTKGLKAHQHEMALLRTEVRDLRDANHILSRRRRERKTRLRNGGSMTIDEGIALIDQKEVDSQVVAESSRRGGRARSTQLGIRHCGVCGKAGHNSRTCQVNIEASGDEYSD